MVSKRRLFYSDLKSTLHKLPRHCQEALAGIFILSYAAHTTSTDTIYHSLYDTLAADCNSIKANIWLSGAKLLVGYSRNLKLKIKPYNRREVFLKQSALQKR